MISVQNGYDGSGQRRGKVVVLDQSGVHDNGEKCKVQAYTRIPILRMEGKNVAQY